MNGRDEIRQALAEWFEVAEQEGGLSTVRLCHFQNGAAEIEIHSMKDGVGPWKDVDKMAEMFDTIASRHARGVVGSGVQQFQLEGGFGTPPKPKRYLPFMRAGAMTYGAGSPSGALATEPPTPMGQTQQEMRHREVWVTGTFAQAKHNADVQQTIIDRLTTRVQYLEGEEIKMRDALWKAVEALQMLKQDAGLKLAEFIRNTKERERWQMILPSAVNSITGRDVFPQSTADTAALEGLYDSLPERGRTQLIESVMSTHPERGALVAARFAEFDKINRNRKAELDRMLRESHRAMDLEEIIAEGAGDMFKKHANGEAEQIPQDATVESEKKPEPAPETASMPSIDKPQIDIRWPLRNPADRDKLVEALGGLLGDVARDYKVASVEDDDTVRYSGSEGVMSGVHASWKAGTLEFEIGSGLASGVKGVAIVGQRELRVQVALPLLLRMAREKIESRIREEAAKIGVG